MPSTTEEEDVDFITVMVATVVKAGYKDKDEDNKLKIKIKVTPPINPNATRIIEKAIKKILLYANIMAERDILLDYAMILFKRSLLQTLKELQKNIEIVAAVVSVKRAPVVVLNVTFMSAFRSDAHIGNWSDVPSVEDCSHWCLPGVPDAWNEILLSYLPKKKGV
ncbi:trichome berefringence-like 7 protein [Nymphaea thermarum]|nr:trichome berefringence-like 7 protein [Nymphaea thermarum]